MSKRKAKPKAWKRSKDHELLWRKCKALGMPQDVIDEIQSDYRLEVVFWVGYLQGGISF